MAKRAKKFNFGKLNPLFLLKKLHPKNIWNALKWRNLKKKLTWPNIKKALIYGGAGFVLLIILLGAWIAKDLPSSGKLQSRLLSESTKIYARDGTLLYEVYGDKKRTVVPLSNISKDLQNATIAVEDKNFYNHGGIDFFAIIRSFFYNLTHSSKIQGGSTLTQQFVKNALLSPEKTFTRKIKEALLSIVIEHLYSKDKILEMYLNEIPYGSNTYGAEAASQTYFSKSAKDLTLEESATIASLPKAPTYYSPYGTHTSELLYRKDFVLDKMAEQGYVSKEKSEQAKQQKIAFVKRKENITAPHFVMYVRQLLVDKYGEKMVDEGGLKVTTSLDLSKQKMAEDVVAQNAPKNLKRFAAHNASMVSMNPQTGEVLAMVGSVDYFDDTNDGNVNVALSLQEPGSSFKPYAYANAFKNGYSPATMLIDVKTDFGGGYKPDNFDGKSHGIQSARTALAGSLNIPAVKMLYMGGLDSTLDLVEQMGITTLKDRSKYGLSLTLGGGSVTPLEHTAAMGVFATQGIKHDIHPILKIEDGRGKVLEEYKKEEDKGKEVLPAPVAYQIQNIMSDNQARSFIFGSHSPLILPDRPVGAKTGTTQDFRDGWTLGYTPSLVTGVWVGNNDNTPMHKGEAVFAAAPIWNDFMKKALSGTPVEQFQRPPGVVDLTVAKVSGLLPSANTKETKKEIFAKDYNMPKGKDNVYVSKTIECPGGPKQVSFAQLHAEIPKEDPAYPRWEAAVRGFAGGAGFGSGEEENCSGFDIQVGVSLSKTSVKLGDSFTATATPSGTVQEVKFYFDSNLIDSDNSSPYSTTYSVPGGTSIGSHTVKVIAIDSGGNQSSGSATIQVTYDINFTLTCAGGTYTATASGPDVSKIDAVKIYIGGGGGNTMAGSGPWTYAAGSCTNAIAKAFEGATVIVTDSYP